VRARSEVEEVEKNADRGFGMTIHHRKTFEFCRRFQGVGSALAARGRIPPKRMRIEHAAPHAEKRLALRHGRGLTVVLWRVQKKG
jgi:hypothetical protein